MSYYEYTFVTLPLESDEEQVIRMGLGDSQRINLLLRDLINERAKEGWEPLYPFNIPDVWFRRVVNG